MTRLISLAELQSIEKVREQEILEARAIQSAMLPGVALRTRQVHIAYEFQPFTEVGGDFLDYFSLTDDTIGLYLGDVTGKGLPAAMYSALAVGTLRGVHKTGTAPAAVLAQFNKRLMIRGMSLRYSAVQYAVLDPRSGWVRIASAGMPGPLLIQQRGCLVLQLSGIPPGMLPGSDYEAQELRLDPGDSLLFVSDGLTDAVNFENDMFSVDHLAAACSHLHRQSPERILARVFAEVEQFSRGHAQQDDRTAAVLQFLGDSRDGER